MQVLEVYYDGCKEYFLLSRSVIGLINVMCEPSSVKLDENTMCDWTISAAQLRAILSQAVSVTDATNLMRMIIAIEHKHVKLCGTSWQNLTAWSGQWFDLKPQARTKLEELGITDGTFIFQGV